MQQHRGVKLILALLLILPLPLMTNALAASNTAGITQSQNTEVETVPTLALKGIVSKASAVRVLVFEASYEAGRRAGKQVRKWTSYRGDSLIQFGGVLLPENALD